MLSSAPTLVKILLALATLLYPVAVYMGLEHLDVRHLVALLVLLAGLRFFSLGNSPLNHWLWLPVLLLVALGTWFSGSDLGLKLYPVLVNLSLLLVFGWSLHNPPSLIERLARLKEPDLPPHAIAYTRKVTLVWCLFFAINGTLALVTALWGSNEVWALYNGLVAYVLMGLLFAIEWLVRQAVQRKHAGEAP